MKSVLDRFVWRGRSDSPAVCSGGDCGRRYGMFSIPSLIVAEPGSDMAGGLNRTRARLCRFHSNVKEVRREHADHRYLRSSCVANPLPGCQRA